MSYWPFFFLLCFSFEETVPIVGHDDRILMRTQRFWFVLGKYSVFMSKPVFWTLYIFVWAALVVATDTWGKCWSLWVTLAAALLCLWIVNSSIRFFCSITKFPWKLLSPVSNWNSTVPICIFIWPIANCIMNGGGGAFVSKTPFLFLVWYRKGSESRLLRRGSFHRNSVGSHSIQSFIQRSRWK